MSKDEESRSPSHRRKFSLTYHQRDESLDKLSKKCSSLLRHFSEPKLKIRDGGWAFRDDVIYFALQGRPRMKADDVITVLERSRDDGSYRFETMSDGDGVWARALERRRDKRRRESVPQQSETPLSLLNQPVQLQPEPTPMLLSPSAWLNLAGSSVPHEQQPVPSAGQALVPALHTTTPASLLNRLVEPGFKMGEAVRICSCGVPCYIGCCGILGQLDADLGLWTVHMDGGQKVRCPVSQLRLCGDLQQADNGAGNAGTRQSWLAGGDRPSDTAPVAIPRSSQQPRSSEQPVFQSVKLIAPSGRTRDLHLLIQMTVQDILKALLPRELEGQDNVAIFNMTGKKIEPNLTLGDLAVESEQLVLQLQTDDW